MPGPSSSKKVIYAALIGNLLIAVTKFVASGLTGSSAMLSEAVHSLVDTGNEVLLLHGLRRAALPPDALHPLGHGRELYFWSFIVAVLIFALGAGVSLYEGVTRMLNPEPIEDPVINYAVIGLSFVFESVSWRIALKEFRAVKGEFGYFEAMHRSKDPPSFMVLFEDSAALLGLFFALLGTAASVTFDRPIFDGLASVAIGIVLAATAVLLARESKGLLIGEEARPELVASLCAMARAQPGIERAGRPLTVHLGPRQIVAALSLDFADDLSAGEIEAAVAALERRIRAAHPEIATLFIKPQAITPQVIDDSPAVGARGSAEIPSE